MREENTKSQDLLSSLLTIPAVNNSIDCITPIPTDISGPSSNVSLGIRVFYYAYVSNNAPTPYYFHWSIMPDEPENELISTGTTCGIIFNKSGNYTLMVKIENTCGLGPWKSLPIHVGYYW